MSLFILNQSNLLLIMILFVYYPFVVHLDLRLESKQRVNGGCKIKVQK